MTIPSKLIETTEANLRQLIAEVTQEGPHVDFKRELPGNWDSAAKHELFADVSAFANAGGGDIIYGMAEDNDGQAAFLVPLALNPDETVRRLADFLLHGVEPRMPGVQVHPVPVTVDGVQGFAFIVRVPQSWVGPHRVKSNYKFYIREGNRKRELDIPEIKGLFLRSESQAQKVRDFRTERLGKISIGETPCRLASGSVWVLHLIPTQSALGVGVVDPLPYLDYSRQMPLLGSIAGEVRINLDGALGIRNTNADGLTHGYTQIFRNGFIEAVSVLTSNPHVHAERRILPGANYEMFTGQFLTRVREELGNAGIHAEVTSMMSLLDADRLELGFNRFSWNVHTEQGSFDRKTVVLPDVLVPADADPLHGLKPMFDMVWQAAGMRGSINFDENGQWMPAR